jgi:hypothetical protein
MIDPAVMTTLPEVVEMHRCLEMKNAAVLDLGLPLQPHTGIQHPA